MLNNIMHQSISIWCAAINDYIRACLQTIGPITHSDVAQLSSHANAQSNNVVPSTLGLSQHRDFTICGAPCACHYHAGMEISEW